MTEQPALWTEPHWTDGYPIGTRVTEQYLHIVGTVVANDGRRITVEYQDHPMWGTYRTTYGMDHLIEREDAA